MSIQHVHAAVAARDAAAAELDAAERRLHLAVAAAVEGGATQTKVARAVGVSRMTIIRWMRAVRE